MKIIGRENEQVIIKELGFRIKQYRISLNITQNGLADKCGLSSSTVVRIESGEDSKISNYIKIMEGLGLLSNIDVLIPEVQPDFKAMFENRTPRQRVKTSHSNHKSNWVWGEDKREVQQSGISIDRTMA